MQEPYDTGAEQAARRTAAAAVLADYQRAAGTADVADRAMWAARLADMLGYLLAGTGTAGEIQVSTRTGSAAPPLETEQQARELPAVRAVYTAFGADPGVGRMAPHNMRMLLDAVAAAGVYIGAYDVRILEWLAGYEPATCAVIAGLITRAAAAGKKKLPPGYESTIGQAFRDAIRYCEREGRDQHTQASQDQVGSVHDENASNKVLPAEQRSFYISIARELGIEVDR